MECDDARLLQEWVLSWNGLIEGEIVPVVPSAETQKVVQPYLSAPTKLWLTQPVPQAGFEPATCRLEGGCSIP